jgi:hypothetical protein
MQVQPPHQDRVWFNFSKVQTPGLRWRKNEASHTLFLPSPFIGEGAGGEDNFTRKIEPHLIKIHSRQKRIKDCPRRLYLHLEAL